MEWEESCLTFLKIIFEEWCVWDCQVLAVAGIDRHKAFDKNYEGSIHQYQQTPWALLVLTHVALAVRI